MFLHFPATSAFVESNLLPGAPQLWLWKRTDSWKIADCSAVCVVSCSLAVIPAKFRISSRMGVLTLERHGISDLHRCSFFCAAILQLHVRGGRTHKRPFDEERLRTYTNTHRLVRRCVCTCKQPLQDECSIDPLLQAALWDWKRMLNKERWVMIFLHVNSSCWCFWRTTHEPVWK